MNTPRKITVFDNDEQTSVITQREDVAGNNSIKNIFGIDLGTTNSAISVVKGGRPEIIQVDDNDTIPSCVMWKNGEFIVGKEAYNNKALPNVVYSVKRLMEDPNATVTLVDGENTITMTPVEVSAEILKGIVRATHGKYGDIHDVVVTVPAYFNDIGKRNTMSACELAGLNLIALENEPSAAALEYDLPEGVTSEDILIYDLGGGTFDITLARISQLSKAPEFDIYNFTNANATKVSKIIKPMALGGNGRLGGDDIDDALFNIVFDKIGLKREQLSLSDVKKYTARFERLKKGGVNELYETVIDCTLIDGTTVNEQVHIGPDDFIEATMGVYKKTRKEILRVLKEVPNNVSKILLVGGSTKNPIIREQLKKDFPNFEISATLHPDEVVALGASVKGRIIKYGDSSISSFDILPMTIGILDCSDVIIPVLKKNTELPTTASSPFTTERDMQEEMRVAIYQGNSTFKDECVYLGDLIISGIPKAPAGEPQLLVKLTVTANNVLICEASVDGITKTLQLSLNNDSVATKGATREEKSLIRWRALIPKFTGKKREEFERLLAQYPDKVDRNMIRDFLKKNLTEK